MAFPLENFVTHMYVFIFVWFVVYFQSLWLVWTKIITNNLLKFHWIILLVMVDVLRYCVGFSFGGFGCFKASFLDFHFFQVQISIAIADCSQFLMNPWLWAWSQSVFILTSKMITFWWKSLLLPLQPRFMNCCRGWLFALL